MEIHHYEDHTLIKLDKPTKEIKIYFKQVPYEELRPELKSGKRFAKKVSQDKLGRVYITLA